MLGGQKLYFDKIGLGFEKEDDERSSEVPRIKFLHVSIVLKGDTSEKCFSKRKTKK